MLADQHLRRLLHRIAIECAKCPTDPPGFERRADRRLQEQIAVAAAGGAEACVEALVDRLAPLDRHIGRQVAIGAAHPGNCLPFHGRVDVDHLVDRVHPGVSAASTGDSDRDICELRQRLLDACLNRVVIGLTLPATVGAAAVGQAQCQPAHCGARRSGARPQCVAGSINRGRSACSAL